MGWPPQSWKWTTVMIGGQPMPYLPELEGLLKAEPELDGVVAIDDLRDVEP